MNAPIRVLRIITRLNIGGPAIQAIELSNRLPSLGFPTLLVHGSLGPGEGDMRTRLRIRDAEDQFVPALRRPVQPAGDVHALRILYRLIRQFQPDIVHTHTAKAGALGRLAAAFYNRRYHERRPIRLVHTYHGHVLDGYFPPLVAKGFSATEQWLARRTDAIVAISPVIRRELLTTYRIGVERQYVTIPLGFDLSSLARVDDADRRAARQRLGVPSTAPVVVTLGRLTAVKRFDLFLQTASLVRRQMGDALFLMAGDGDLRESLETQAQALGLQDVVRFLGWRSDVTEVYAAADLFLLSSRNEGTPVALIEAMAAGVPGVATDVGGVRDVLNAEDLGACVASDRPEHLAEAVCRLLDDEPQRRAMGKRARASALERYGIDRLVDEITALYRRIRASA